MSTKVNVLKALEEKKGSTISGEELAGILGVSRTAIWKAIRELRKDGYSIDAITNKGYSLSINNDVVSAQGILSYLNVHEICDRIFVYKSLESTNQTAKKLALEGAQPGTVVIAEEQTKGRGRMGRSFFSPPESGIYLSIILKPSFNINKSVLITTAASVAVCKAIEETTGISSQIKWVNDIYVNNKKICGILTEAVTDFETGHIEYIILGIGINYKTSEEGFPSEISDIAGSLYEERFSCHDSFDNINTGTKALSIASRNQLIAEIINNVLQINENLESREFLKDYKSRSLVLGREIRVLRSGSLDAGQDIELAPEATAIDIDHDGGLIVKYKDLTVTTLNSGEISIRLTK